MAINIERRLFTVAEYEQMGRAGILTEDDRVELIDGEIIAMTPIGVRLAACVRSLAELLMVTSTSRFQVSVQSPIVLDDLSEPQPDIVLLRRRPDSYSSRHPGPGDIFLVVEVADSTLDYDQNVKLPRYARAGIPEVWIIDLDADVVTQYREPSGDQYASVQRLAAGASIRLGMLPDVQLDVSAILV